MIVAAVQMSYLHEEEWPFYIHGERSIEIDLCRAFQILGTKFIIRSSVGGKRPTEGERDRWRGR